MIKTILLDYRVKSYTYMNNINISLKHRNEQNGRQRSADGMFKYILLKRNGYVDWNFPGVCKWGLIDNEAASAQMMEFENPFSRTWR